MLTIITKNVFRDKLVMNLFEINASLKIDWKIFSPHQWNSKSIMDLEKLQPFKIFPWTFVAPKSIKNLNLLKYIESYKS